MAILDKLYLDFSVDVSHPAATPEAVNKLINFSSIEVPAEYIEIVQAATEIEISVRNEKYIRIWSPEGCIEMNESYNIQNFIPNSLAIGDDEGGNALLYMTGNNGFGIYLTGFGDLDADDASFVSSSLQELLIDGVGVETIISVA